jgi:diaminopimelate epimerase
MTMIDAYKMNGLGNEFLIIDRRTNTINLSKEKIIELGSGNKFGFDQLIFIEKEIEKTTPVSIFNSDGNEISACGNGVRCIAYLLGKEKGINNVLLRTNERVLKAEIVKDYSVKINMGKPIFEWNKIPLIKNLDNKNITIDLDNYKFEGGFSLNVGNPHVIFFVKDCFEFDLKKIGPKIENYEIFPEKCNVTFAQVNDKNNITVNVWERGAGLTKACGTAACATAVASSIKKLTENDINIKFKEGDLNIKIDNDLNIFMTGPVSDIKHIELEI